MEPVAKWVVMQDDCNEQSLRTFLAAYFGAASALQKRRINRQMVAGNADSPGALTIELGGRVELERLLSDSLTAMENAYDV